MLATVYTRELEPITVVSLAPWAVQMLNESRGIAFPVHPKIPSEVLSPNDPCDDVKSWVVRLRGELLCLGRYSTWILIAEDEELALMLRAAFLPGQRGALNGLQRKAYAKGINDAVEIIGRLGRDEA